MRALHQLHGRLPSTAAGLSGITDNNFTDEKPVLFLTNSNGDPFSIAADKQAFHTQRITALSADGAESTSGYRLYLADNNPSATSVDEIDVYSITFDANGQQTQELQTLGYAETAEAMIADRIDLKAAFPAIPAVEVNIQVGQRHHHNDRNWRHR